MFNKKRPHVRYDKQQLINGVRAVTDNQLSSMKASRVYHIPESTIRSHAQNTSTLIESFIYLQSKNFTLLN